MSMHKVTDGIARTWAIVYPCIVILAVASCAPLEEKEPDYHVMTPHELHVRMDGMANSLNKIASLALEDSMSEEQKTPLVLSELTRIKGIANDIAEPGEITNYSVINRYMDAFIYDVHVAEKFSRRTPPNHFPSYTLVKSCLSCHDSI